jgi:sialate O-acetylesterase
VRPIGFELCGAATGSCHYADADIQDDQVLLRPARQPAGGIARVRYCWGDSPVCTLYDQSGLPAGPFQLDVATAR